MSFNFIYFESRSTPSIHLSVEKQNNREIGLHFNFQKLKDNIDQLFWMKYSKNGKHIPVLLLV